VQLGQSSSTGGEAQRIKLASFLVGDKEKALFVFDEPTTGCFHDIETFSSFDANERTFYIGNRT
jgi:excinuclease UvrABC ATPase subunit